MAADTIACDIDSDARALLSAERPALNFLQLLSATATVTRSHAKAIEGASPNPRGCVVLDTRKTIPGLRQAQKYAVRVGGGANQRLALWHGILIKENHIAAAGGIWLARGELKARQEAFETDARIAHRLLQPRHGRARIAEMDVPAQAGEHVAALGFHVQPGFADAGLQPLRGRAAFRRPVRR